MSILKDFTGRNIYDRWTSYFELETVQHELCKVHLVRELQAFADNKCIWVEEMRVFMLGIHAQSTDFPLIGLSAGQVRQRYKQILDQVE